MEGPLHRVQGTVRRGQPLDRRDTATVGLHRQYGTALHAPGGSVRVGHQHRAGATVAGIATDDRADLPELLAQVVNEQRTRGDVVDVLNSVDGDTDPGHKLLRRGTRAVYPDQPTPPR